MDKETIKIFLETSPEEMMSELLTPKPNNLHTLNYIHRILYDSAIELINKQSSIEINEKLTNSFYLSDALNKKKFKIEVNFIREE